MEANLSSDPPMKREFDEVELEEGEEAERQPATKKAKKKKKRKNHKEGGRNNHNHSDNNNNGSKQRDVDPTYGQRYALAGMHTRTVVSDEELDIEDESDALLYLRAVQQEASGIPRVMTVPKPTKRSRGAQQSTRAPQQAELNYDDDDGDRQQQPGGDAPSEGEGEDESEDDDDDGRPSFGGYYQDGAYTAVPDEWLYDYGQDVYGGGDAYGRDVSRSASEGGVDDDDNDGGDRQAEGGETRRQPRPEALPSPSSSSTGTSPSPAEQVEAMREAYFEALLARFRALRRSLNGGDAVGEDEAPEPEPENLMALDWGDDWVGKQWEEGEVEEGEWEGEGGDVAEAQGELEDEAPEAQVEKVLQEVLEQVVSEAAEPDSTAEDPESEAHPGEHVLPAIAEDPTTSLSLPIALEPPPPEPTALELYRPKSHLTPFQIWSHRFRYTDPLPPSAVTSVLPDKSAALSAMRVLLAGLFFRSGKDLRPRTQAWLWAVLARLPDKGELDYRDVGEVRELGKRAVLVLVRARATKTGGVRLLRDGNEADEGTEEEEEVVAEGRGEVEGGVDEDGTEEEGATEEVRVTTGTDKDHDAANDSPDEGEVSDDDGPPPPATKKPSGDRPVADAGVDAHRAKLLARVMGIRASADNGSGTGEEDQTQLLTEEAETADDDEPEVDDAQQQAAADAANTRATLNMILTIAGELYGQRDLLEFRDAF